MRPVMPPTFLKRCTTLRGMKTMPPGTRLGGLTADGHLIEPLDDEQNFFLFEMDMVGRAFAGLVPGHDDRGGAAGGLGGEEHSHVEAERLDRQRLLGRDDSGLQWGSRVHGYCLQFWHRRNLSRC